MNDLCSDEENASRRPESDENVDLWVMVREPLQANDELSGFAVLKRDREKRRILKSAYWAYTVYKHKTQHHLGSSCLLRVGRNKK